jgi:acrylyl-CoA reductase (NADPH)
MYGEGDEVLVTGYGIGEEHWGGYSGLARCESDWLVRLPEGLSSRTAMAAGTAGFTAMLSVLTLEEQGLTAGNGKVAVTGASGGVGSFAVALLAAAGHHVVASTGRPELAGYLTELGATEILERDVFAGAPAAAMGSEMWSGAIDCVGGPTLSHLIATTRRHGCVACCGLAGGHELATTVFPFILRGVSLLGIDSNYCPRERRLAAWTRLARDLKPALVERVVHDTVGLSDVQAACEDLFAGKVCGRTVVDLTR